MKQGWKRWVMWGVFGLSATYAPGSVESAHAQSTQKIDPAWSCRLDITSPKVQTGTTTPANLLLRGQEGSETGATLSAEQGPEEGWSRFRMGLSYYPDDRAKYGLAAKYRDLVLVEHSAATYTFASEDRAVVLAIQVGAPVSLKQEGGKSRENAGDPQYYYPSKFTDRNRAIDSADARCFDQVSVTAGEKRSKP